MNEMACILESGTKISRSSEKTLNCMRRETNGTYVVFKLSQELQFRSAECRPTAAHMMRALGLKAFQLRMNAAVLRRNAILAIKRCQISFDKSRNLREIREDSSSNFSNDLVRNSIYEV